MVIAVVPRMNAAHRIKVVLQAVENEAPGDCSHDRSKVLVDRRGLMDVNMRLKLSRVAVGMTASVRGCAACWRAEKSLRAEERKRAIHLLALLAIAKPRKGTSKVE